MITMDEQTTQFFEAYKKMVSQRYPGRHPSIEDEMFLGFLRFVGYRPSIHDPDRLASLEQDYGLHEWQPCVERLVSEGEVDDWLQGTLLDFVTNAARVNRDPDWLLATMRDVNSHAFAGGMDDESLQTMVEWVLNEPREPACADLQRVGYCDEAACALRKHGFAGGSRCH